MLPENVAKVDPLIQSFGLSKRSQYSTHLYGGMILDLVFDILNFNTVSSLRSPYSDHFVCIFVIIYIYIYIFITLLHYYITGTDGYCILIECVFELLLLLCFYFLVIILFFFPFRFFVLFLCFLIFLLNVEVFLSFWLF